MQPQPAPGPVARSGAQRDEAVPFSLDHDNRPIRHETPTTADQDVLVEVIIDGQKGLVPIAVPKLDFLGNPVYRPDGSPALRATTIYDAANLILDEEEARRRIPVLCHQPHVDPVAVCRVCSVQVIEIERGRQRPRRTLAPACQHRVPDKKGNVMWVVTRCYDGSGEWVSPAHDPANIQARQTCADYAGTVEQAVKLLARLLTQDHYHVAPSPRRYENELARVAEDTIGGPIPPAPADSQVRNTRLHPRSRRVELPRSDSASPRDAPPYSARTIEVDHDNCILCDRCVRGCADVKGFNVIGHTGKGYRTRISFDLDRLMNDSSCVQCGECATACPTGALVFRRRVAPVGWPDLPRVPDPDTGRRPSAIHPRFTNPPTGDPNDGILTAEQMLDVQVPYRDAWCGPPRPNSYFRPFAGIPLAYLKWNEGAVRRRDVNVGEVIAHQGEYASTAFLLESGVYQLRTAEEVRRGRWLHPPDEYTRTQEHLILGEMACLTGQRRTLSIEVVRGGVVYEVTRNLLDMMMRTGQGRRALLPFYRERAARECIRRSILHQEFCTTPEERAALEHHFTPQSPFVPNPRQPRQGNAALLNFQPGQRIISEGDPIDGFYILRLGHVQFSRRAEGREVILDIYGGAGGGGHFGEIALMWGYLADEVRRRAPRPDGTRTATAVALDHVEVLWVSQQAFTDFLDEMRTPQAAVVGRLTRQCEQLLNRDSNLPALSTPRRPAQQGREEGPLLPFDRVSATHQAEYVRLGLYQGQKLLVLDLDRCTRCDECTRACADSHRHRDRTELGQRNASRLFREGLRFDHYLVATCCRSCHKPYCLDGCPVDAIHREGQNLEVIIDSHCIGCGLCEHNCPYGAIQMVDARPDSPWQWLRDLYNWLPGRSGNDNPGRRTAAVRRKAVNCDLCQGLVEAGGDPFCVRACPHEAAFRWSGEQLLQMVVERRRT